MTIIKCFKHIYSPFHDNKANIHLNFKQKRNAFLWGLGCGIPFVVPGVIAFYASAYFSKKKCTPQSSSDSSDPSDKKASVVFKKTVNPSHDENNQPLPVDKHQPVVAPVNPPKPLPFGFAELREAETIENVEESLAVILQHNEKDEAFLEKLKSEEPECFGDLLQVAFTLEDFKLLKKLLVFVEPDELEALLEANELIDFELQFPATMENAEKVRQIFGGMEVPDELLEQILTALEEKNEDALEDCLMQAHLESFTDAILKLDLQFSKSYRTNRFLLENRIPFFKTMLNSGFQEASQEKVAIQDQAVSLEAFREALFFTLFKEAYINKDNYQSLVHIADVYELPKLTKFCEDWIIENLNELEDISSFAIPYRLNRVINHCILPLVPKYCEGNITSEEEEKFKELLKHCTFLDLSRLPPIPKDLLFNIIAETRNLTSVHLSNQPFVNNQILFTLQENNPNLKRLHLQNPPKISLKNIGKCLNLEYLDLSCPTSYSPSNVKHLRALQSLTKLKTLKLDYLRAEYDLIDSKELKFLSQLTSLSFLSLKGLTVTDLSFLQLNNLTILDLSNTVIVETSSMISLPQLKAVRLFSCRTLSPTTFQMFEDVEELIWHAPFGTPNFKNFNKLKFLDIRINHRFDKVLTSLADLSTLTSLRISIPKLPKDRVLTLSSALQANKDLESFSLRYANTLPKGAMKQLCTHLPQVRKLTFAILKTKDLEAMSNLDSLEELSFHVKKLTKQHIEKLNAIPNLKILHIQCDTKPKPALLAMLNPLLKITIV